MTQDYRLYKNGNYVGRIYKVANLKRTSANWRFDNKLSIWDFDVYAANGKADEHFGSQQVYRPIS